MYRYLRGSIISKHKETLVLDVGGIGFEIFISLQTAKCLPECGKEYQIHVHPHYREDSHKLFGFATEREKLFFITTLRVNGIGPKVALSILSTFAMSELQTILFSEDSSFFTRVPGIGKKGAQRLFLELKGKCHFLKDDSPTVKKGSLVLEKDIIDALISLGYKDKQARQSFLIVQKKWKDDAWLFENVLKACLFEIVI